MIVPDNGTAAAQLVIHPLDMTNPQRECSTKLSARGPTAIAVIVSVTTADSTVLRAYRFARDPPRCPAPPLLPVRGRLSEDIQLRQRDDGGCPPGVAGPEAAARAQVKVQSPSAFDVKAVWQQERGDETSGETGYSPDWCDVGMRVFESGFNDAEPPGGTCRPRPLTSPERRRPARTGTIKNILITGGTSGLGLAMALALAHDEHQVVLTGRDANRAAEVAATLPGDVHGIGMDVRDATSIASGRE